VASLSALHPSYNLPRSLSCELNLPNAFLSELDLPGVILPELSFLSHPLAQACTPMLSCPSSTKVNFVSNFVYMNWIVNLIEDWSEFIYIWYANLYVHFFVNADDDCDQCIGMLGTIL
jgi:hypothetical protein